MKITDIYNRDLEISEETIKMVQFNNKDGIIEYSAEIVENGKLTGFYTEYRVNGQVENIDCKINSCFNPVKFQYAKFVEYDAQTNDNDKSIWNSLVGFVKSNQEFLLDKYGDFKDSSYRTIACFLKEEFENVA